MKIQVCSLAIALAIAVPIVVAATVESSAAPLNGASIKARVPAVTTECLIGARQVYRPTIRPGPSVL